MGQPGHREIAEEGEEALRRLEDAVSIVFDILIETKIVINMVLIGSAIIHGWE